MKSLKLVFASISILFFIITITSCGGGKKEVETPLYQSYELQGTDTINKVDSAGLKQGQWLFYADKGKKAQKNVTPKLLVKGNYVDDKREGTWFYFNIDGTPSDTVVYRNDFPLEK